MLTKCLDRADTLQNCGSFHIAPVGQKVNVDGDRQRRKSDRRTERQGILLELFGAGQGANDCSVGAPDGVEAARTFKLEPDGSAWDVELLLSVKVLPWGRKRRHRRQGQHAERQGGVPGSRRVCIRKNVEILK